MQLSQRTCGVTSTGTGSWLLWEIHQSNSLLAMDRISIPLSNWTNYSKACFGHPLSSNGWIRIKRKGKWVLTKANLTRMSHLKCAMNWVCLGQIPHRRLESCKVYHPNIAVLLRVEATGWVNRGRILKPTENCQMAGLCSMMAAEALARALMKNLWRIRISRESLCASWAKLVKMKMRTTSSFE